MPGEVIYTGLFHPLLLDNLCTLVTDSEPDYPHIELCSE